MRELHIGDVVQWDYRYIVLSDPVREEGYFKAKHMYKTNERWCGGDSVCWFGETSSWTVVEPTEEEQVAFALFTLTGEFPLDRPN